MLTVVCLNWLTYNGEARKCCKHNRASNQPAPVKEARDG
jgi:hypothetical protein